MNTNKSPCTGLHGAYALLGDTDIKTEGGIECGEYWEGNVPSAKISWAQWGQPQGAEVSGLSKWVDKGSFHCNEEHERKSFGKRLSSF